jgi:hypothetical protein
MKHSYRGSKIVRLRIPDAMLLAIQDALQRSRTQVRGRAPNLSAWIKQAIAEKLASRQRSKLRRLKRESACHP